MSAVYDMRNADVRAALEDAIYNVERALDIARIRGWAADDGTPDQAQSPHPGQLRRASRRSARRRRERLPP